MASIEDLKKLINDRILELHDIVEGLEFEVSNEIGSKKYRILNRLKEAKAVLRMNVQTLKDLEDLN